MSPNFTKLRAAIVTTLIAGTAAHAADVTVQPAAGNGFVVKDAAGANEHLRVQESGAITLPGVPGAAAQSTGLCMSGAGLLGPCNSGSGSGQAYTAATGLSLTGTTFSVAPTYQLPQGCSSTQIPQWNGSAWACATATSASLPAGTYDQTLRYNSSNTLVPNNKLFAFADGGLLATGAYGTGAIPETGAGTRMMWYPAKAAFRAGEVEGTYWDDANVGVLSTALGFDTEASGDDAVALGESTTASGTDSTALGNGTVASGYGSTAMGWQTTAPGNYSTAIGVKTVAGGTDSIAMGNTSNATGDYSIALGDHVNAMGVHSFIFGDGSSSPNQNFATVDRSFVVYAGGGIGLHGDTTINEGTLTVYGTTDITATYSYYPYWYDPAICSSCTVPVSVYAPNGRVMALEFDALSDARIKDVAGVSDSARDLAALKAIEITDYTMKDKIVHGNTPFKKVIAQQIEKVYPQIVSKHTDFIPDVYRMATKIEQVDGGYKLSFDAPHGLAANAKKLKLLPEGRRTFEQVEIVSVPSPNEVIVRASGWTAERVFVFGEEVDDLRTVDYEGLTALNVSATQELSKRLDVQQTNQAQLTAQLADEDAQIEALRLDLATQKARVVALESVAGDLAALNRQFVELRKQLEASQTLAHDRIAPSTYPRRKRADATLVAAAQP